MTVSISNKTEKKHIFFVFCSAAMLLAIWQLAAWKTASSLIVPSPAETGMSLLRLWKQASFRTAAGMTVFRSIAAFTVSFFLSIALGALTGISRAAGAFLQLPMSIVKAAPVVSFILLALFWFSTGTVPVFVSVLMTFPVMTAAVCNGIRNTDRKLLEMANVYGFSRTKTIRCIYIPSVIPYISGSALSAFGQSWKVVVAAEVIGLPRYAAGSVLYTAKVHLETADVFAVSISIVLLSFLCEKAAAYLVRRLGSRYGTSRTA